MPETISQQDLERYFWGAAVLLRGYIDSSDYKQFIFPLLYFKRVCDVYDEETAEVVQEYGPGVGEDFAEYHRFTIPKGSHWKDVREKTTDVGVAIQNAMRETREDQSRTAGRDLWRCPVDEQEPALGRDTPRSHRAFLFTRRSRSPMCRRTNSGRATST